MKTYRTPIYPALMLRVGSKNVKASGGLFEIEDEDVEAFEALVAQRPHYRIRAYPETDTSPDPDELGIVEMRRQGLDEPDPVPVAGAEHGLQTRDEPMSESERHPENAKVRTVDSMTPQELGKALMDRKLPTTGDIPALRERLAAALNEENPGSVPTGGPDAA